MTEDLAGPSEKQWNIEDVTDHGERVSPQNQDFVFYGHLSIYHFALQFCRGQVVLDAGTGTGYGSAYFADQGARQVYGIDVSEKSIEFSKHHYRKPNLEFRTMDLNSKLDFVDSSFDFIFTSNTLEHISNPTGFFRETCRLLKPGGILLVAVPPITDERLEYLNLINEYHVNIWSPRQWLFCLKEFYKEATPYLHGVEAIGADFKPEHMSPEARMRVDDFVFAPGKIDDMYRRFTLTSIFVARSPRSVEQLPEQGKAIKMIDHSYSRPAGQIDPEIRKRLRKYFDPISPSADSLWVKALRTLREDGAAALTRKAFDYFKRKATR